jgi:hypothetical protein
MTMTTTMTTAAPAAEAMINKAAEVQPPQFFVGDRIQQVFPLRRRLVISICPSGMIAAHALGLAAISIRSRNPALCDKP